MARAHLSHFVWSFIKAFVSKTPSDDPDPDHELALGSSSSPFIPIDLAYQVSESSPGPANSMNGPVFVAAVSFRDAHFGKALSKNVSRITRY